MDDPELPGMAAKGTAVFGEAVAMVADALGIELDDIVCEAEYARATADVVMDSWTIPADHVAGVYASWQGKVGDRTVVELNVRWRKGQTLEPDWQIKEGHVIKVDGRPTVTVALEYLPPPDFEATTFAEFMVLGMIMTAMPAINSIPYVVAAPPGIVTYTDLPLILPRGLVSSADRCAVIEVDDVEAIRRLKARYFRTMDTKDWDAMRHVFTDDVVIDTSEAGGNVVSGADEFMSFLTRNFG